MDGVPSLPEPTGACSCSSTPFRWRALKSPGSEMGSNVTDIDADILHRAREIGEDWHTLGNRF